MTLTVGTNTYATLAEADAYAATRSWAATWAALADAVREQRLADAAIYLDTSYTWKGQIADEDQVMSWPRVLVRDKEGRLIASDAYPTVLKYAQVELAYLASAALVTNESAGQVTALTAGSVSLTFKDSQTASEASKYRSIDRLLTGLYISRAGSVRNIPLLKG
ncbi:MAG TPA: hypothetical protein PLR76_09905 [Hyphomonas sp.]|nr:hypothetical protein [Hyphomonas sp.]